MGKLQMLKDLLAFARENKRYWLLPAAILLLLMTVLALLAQGSALAPFIYTLF